MDRALEDDNGSNDQGIARIRGSARWDQLAYAHDEEGGYFDQYRKIRHQDRLRRQHQTRH